MVEFPPFPVQCFPDDCPKHLPRGTPLTPLAFPILEVFAIARKHGYLPYSPVLNKKGDGNEKGQEKYCQYHSSSGHLTEDCHQLKRDIECLIRGGHLKQVVAARKQPGQEARHEPAAPTEEAVTHEAPEGGYEQINAIFGGPTNAGYEQISAISGGPTNAGYEQIKAIFGGPVDAGREHISTIVSGPTVAGSSRVALKASVREILSTAHTAKKPRGMTERAARHTLVLPNHLQGSNR